MGKGEIVHYEQALLLPRCFQKTLLSEFNDRAAESAEQDQTAHDVEADSALHFTQNKFMKLLAGKRLKLRNVL